MLRGKVRCYCYCSRGCLSIEWNARGAGAGCDLLQRQLVRILQVRCNEGRVYVGVFLEMNGILRRPSSMLRECSHKQGCSESYPRTASFPNRRFSPLLEALYRGLPPDKLEVEIAARACIL